MGCLFGLLLAFCATAAMSRAADRPKLSPAEQEIANVSMARYESRPGDDLETIYVKDGRLWSQVGEDEAEYFPAGADTFFLKNEDLATFVFSRDGQGHVTGYVYHRIDGQEIRVKKTK
jgi:hypothetical protein